jgi:hypothetical protein
MGFRVTQVYFGDAEGCACGCRGNYYERGAMVTRALNALRKAAPASVVCDPDAACVEVPTSPTRCVRIYFEADVSVFDAAAPCTQCGAARGVACKPACPTGKIVSGAA